MKGLYFLPKWYVKNLSTQMGRRFKFIIVLLLIINLLLVNLFIANKNKLTALEDKLRKTAPVEKNLDYDDRTFKCFSNFYECVWKERNFKDISIHDGNVDFSVEDEKDCFSLAGDIEKSNKFIIEDLKCLGTAGDQKKIWQIGLRLK
ncbi:MAG TPA: hypothetical protein DC034_02625 [Clostridium sp.]|uniref:DUF4363 family protein n=1 Tax=Clostridium lapidicellarium TaxID=3240931 RepID=A0ABV4DSR7_9CLOT|nr:hypothetical protein [uncultured Clostridium sp.]NLU08068.1 hypothetical protein [Clostridiales bacterium]HBC95673.1 hypothetical protein [Clostridium sp.]